MKREEEIRIAQELLSCGALSKEACDAIKADFPELCESDDERIRKALIKEFKKKLENGFSWMPYDIPNHAVLAWLEKQKEQRTDAKTERVIMGNYRKI